MQTLKMRSYSKYIYVLSCITILFCAATSAVAQLPPESEWEEEGVCAKVRIQINQQVAITRTAFRATLEINNSAQNCQIDHIGVTLDIKNAEGVAANNLFGIKPPELTGLADISGSGTLAPGSSGKSVWTIIPTRDAAPDYPLQYSVGGTLQYHENGQQITIPLFPATITVRPDPRLVLNYFLVRNVYSDDPFTAEVEPAEPYPLGLILQNIGKGTAHNVKIASSQPEIIENEKGLLVDFKIIGTQVNTEAVSPSLTVDLGEIGAGQTSVAQWIMTTSLQGKFIEYSAKFEHVDDLGDPRLSLIDSVKIHEIIHAVRVDVPDDDRKPDFLANDVYDDNFLPDTLYKSDGSTAPVNLAANPTIVGQLSSSMKQVNLTANMPSGWVYLRVDDPGKEQYRLKRVVRADGREIKVDENAWATHRTIRLVGQAPYRQNLLHLLDFTNGGNVEYTLYYEGVATKNQPPVLEFVPNQTVATGKQIRITLKATDPDGTVPTISASQLPPGATFSDQKNGTAVFEWIPVATQEGTYSLTFTADDGELSDLKTAQIIVHVETLIAISGYLRTPDGAAIPYATFSGFPDNSVATDENGYYAAFVAPGWSGTITPKKGDYVFTPANRTYSNVTADQNKQDYSGASASAKYTISGHVFAAEGVTGMEGVTMTASPGNLIATTNANGTYTLSVNSGWTGTVSASKSGYTFTPSSQTYNNLTVDQSNKNYTGILPKYTISGRVTYNGAGLADVVLTGLPGTPKTDATGAYSATVPQGWSGTAAPYKLFYSFTSVYRTYTAVGVNLPNQNYTAISNPAACADRTVCNGDFSNGSTHWFSGENAAFVPGRSGLGVQVNHDTGNSDYWQQLRGVFDSGKTYRASVWCLADVGEECWLFLGDANLLQNSIPYENTAQQRRPGTGAWQLLSVALTLKNAERLDFYVYARTPGGSVIYDDAQIIEQTACPSNTLCNGDFEQGDAYWRNSENVSFVAGLTDAGALVKNDAPGNSDLWQPLPGVFKAGTYHATAWCLADVGEECRLFVGDANTSYGAPYEQTAYQSLPGNGQWQQLSVTLNLTHDERLDIYLYAKSANSAVLYDDVTFTQDGTGDSFILWTR